MNSNNNDLRLAPNHLERRLDDHYRNLQFQIPDYTSPPLPEALILVPEEYQDDEVMDEARDLAAAGNCTIDGNRCHIPFPASDKYEDSRVGVVFYNGGLVDPRGYAPIAKRLNALYGIPVVMPIFANDLAFTFGVCDSGRLDFAKAEFPAVEKWILAGHSFGAVAASVDLWSRWEEDDSAAGLVLLAADVQGGLGCGDTTFANTTLPMAQLLASNDGILNTTRVALNEINNSEDNIFVEIEGANHASFGAYNASERFAIFGEIDGEAGLPSERVWDLTAETIMEVVKQTGVELPLLRTPDGTSGAAFLSSPSILSIWSTIAFFGWLFGGN